MLSKTDATDLVVKFTNTLRDRVNAFLVARARQGYVGGVFRYTDQDTGPKAQAVKAELEAGGWTVVVDTGAKTVTIS